MPRKTKKKTTPIPEVKTVELPKDNISMEEYIECHRLELFNSIVDNIQYALDEKIEVVEVFAFKKTDFVVVVNRKDFIENLDLAYEYGLKNEYYELCAKVKKAKDKFNQTSFIVNYKINNKPYVEEKTSAKTSSEKSREK